MQVLSVVDTSQNYIYFQGTDNSLWRTDLQGGNGVHLGGFNTASPPFVVQPSNQPVNGSGTIPYIVLLVVYSPPGTNEGKSNSSGPIFDRQRRGVDPVVRNLKHEQVGCDGLRKSHHERRR